VNENLWEKLIENIRYDIKHGDCEALYEVLSFLPDDTLCGYLDEDEAESLKSNINQLAKENNIVFNKVDS